jgi:F-type H+-transporting ATPase subunit gamma
MSGLKQLRNRVKSIKSTQKITKAMQVVSAAKLQKVKEQAENLNLYSEVLGNIIYDISTGGNIMDLPAKDRMFFSKKLKTFLRLNKNSVQGLLPALQDL